MVVMHAFNSSTREAEAEAEAEAGRSLEFKPSTVYRASSRNQDYIEKQSQKKY